ncbi:MAG: hypothetical protein JF586_10810 [Burkholderiales bacterium]|nr:hypothetical protein [Burkholderiales bacterium]
MTASARRAGSVAVMAAAAAAHVAVAASVTPSGDSVPENLLRIELHLARPLSHALAMTHVRLVDEDGEPIAGAFLDLPLRGDGGRTITLLLHPGRVKTGVGANVAMGRALRAGHDVGLVVDDPQLPAPIRKRWHVTRTHDEGLLARDWRLSLPAVGSRAPLRVTLDSALTSSSAGLIAVRAPGGERMAGVASLREGETVWEFVPTRPWRAGHHALVVHPRLEDVAGNRPCTPFETVGLSTIPCTLEERGFDLSR